MLFIDLDQKLSAQAGMSITSIFEHQGEARFRELESSTLIGLLSEATPTLVSVGGGALVNDANRAAARARATVVWLQVSASEAAQRVAGDSGRPLLAGHDVEERLGSLLQAREATYADSDFRVDTNGRSLSEIVDALCARLLKESP